MVLEVLPIRLERRSLGGWLVVETCLDQDRVLGYVARNEKGGWSAFIDYKPVGAAPTRHAAVQAVLDRAAAPGAIWPEADPPTWSRRTGPTRADAVLRWSNKRSRSVEFDRALSERRPVAPVH